MTTFALDFDGVLLLPGITNRLTIEESQEIFDAWKNSGTGQVSGILTNGSVYSFWCKKDEKITASDINRMLFGENGKFGAFVSASHIPYLKICLSILSANDIHCVPATNRLFRDVLIHEPGMKTALQVFDLAFGKDRTFLTLKQYEDICTSELKNAIRLRPKINPKVLILEKIQVLFSETKENIYLLDDSFENISAALTCGYQALPVVNDSMSSPVPSVVTHLVGLMIKLIPPEELKKSIEDYPDPTMKAWLNRSLDILKRMGTYSSRNAEASDDNGEVTSTNSDERGITVSAN